MGIRQNYPFDISSLYADEFEEQYTIPKEKGKYILGIGLTSRCNYRCPICYYHNDASQINQDRDISLDVLRTVFKNCGSLQCINFALEGEPFCYPYLFQALDSAMEAAEAITISTNASLLTYQKLQALSEYNISVFSLSIDAADEEGYARFRHGGQLATFISNAGMAADFLGDAVIFNAVLFQQNLHSVLELPKLAALTGVSTIALMPLRPHPGSRSNGISTANFEDLKQCLAEMIEKAVQYNIALSFDGFSGDKKIMDWLAQHSPNMVKGALPKQCIIPWHYTSILSSGELFPCCGDFKPAKISTYDFDGIYNHPYLRLLRACISQNRPIPACKACDYM